MKQNINYVISDIGVDKHTILPTTIRIEKKSWFQKPQAIVTIKEYYTGESKLVVQPRFEEIAIDIYEKYLKAYNLKNVKWLHYNEYMNIQDSNAIERYSEVKIQVRSNRIVNAEWEVLNDRFDLN